MIYTCTPDIAIFGLYPMLFLHVCTLMLSHVSDHPAEGSGIIV